MILIIYKKDKNSIIFSNYIFNVEYGDPRGPRKGLGLDYIPNAFTLPYLTLPKASNAHSYPYGPVCLLY